jgi:hypothetical protein
MIELDTIRQDLRRRKAVRQTGQMLEVLIQDGYARTLGFAHTCFVNRGRTVTENGTAKQDKKTQSSAY